MNETCHCEEKKLNNLCPKCGKTYDTCPCYVLKTQLADKLLKKENAGITDYWAE